MSEMRYINRDNYEAWFLDYLEGSLTDKEQHQLSSFLLNNPDLKQDLHKEDLVRLPSDYMLSFDAKQKLRRAPSPFSELSEYEFAMADALENGNPFPMERAKMSAADQKEWTLYKSTILRAQPVKYPRKKALKRRSFAILPAAFRVAAAAILLMLLYNTKDSTELIEGRHKGHYEPSTQISSSLTASIPEQTKELADNVTNNEQTKAVLLEAPIIMDATFSINEKDSEIEEYRAYIKLIGEQQIRKQLAELGQPEIPNVYETGLKLMMPHYINNHNSLAALYELPETEALASASEKSNTITSELLKRINPLNISYDRIYDEAGELVAVNLSADGFELSQRIPKWLNRRE